MIPSENEDNNKVLEANKIALNYITHRYVYNKTHTYMHVCTYSYILTKLGP